ncbi:ECF transporter S component [Microbacterium marinilacus]|uniref:ECF transporter S component n=1 Tax=Microbacterium marinilacus TaxID=415209 RepID=A0ABP7BLT9_9MICO|nr:ECF transporter S component [Microbacterium marinilacus]MBY0689703.1 ECF transporter S component [Microbacterium marinilacus]
MNTSASPSEASATATPTARRHRWRVVDIVVASVVGVAAGVVFWLWGLAWPGLDTVLAFTPGLSGLLAGGWLFAGVLGGLIIRKPGAALFTEVVAAVVSMAIGTQWGPETFIWGLVQGVAAELGFAILLYANWRLLGALVSGALAGVAVAVLDTSFSSVAALSVEARTVYFVAAVVSGIVIAGLVSWVVVRALAATGALDRFAAGREARARGLGSDAA